MSRKIRFIISVSNYDAYSNATWQEWRTVDASVPELEMALMAGGRAESGHCVPSLIGCEIIDDAAAQLAESKERE